MTEETTGQELKAQPARRFNWGKLGILLTSIGLIIFIFVFGYGYFQLAKIDIRLVKMITSMQTEINQHRQAIADIQKSVNEWQVFSQKSQSLLMQQEQLIAEWKAAQQGNLDKWKVAEAQYLVKLANDHLQFSHHLSLAKHLLELADQILTNVKDPAITPIRESIANNLSTITSSSEVDESKVYLQLFSLNQQVDQLPLPSVPLQKETPSQDIATEGLSWWRAGLAHTLKTLRQIIIVRKFDSTALPPMQPEEKVYLYQNLHAQLETAMWSVLHRNAAIYQTSLIQAIRLTQTYFTQDAENTKKFIENLQALQKLYIEPPIISLSNTLQLFENYFTKAQTPP